MLKRKSTKELVVATSSSHGAPEEGPQENRSAKPEPGELRAKLVGMVRSRGFAGVLCILAGLLVAFVLMPMLQARESRTAPVLVLSQNVAAGTEITGDMLSVEERGVLNLPVGALRQKEDAQGKFVTVAGMAGDILTAGRLSAQIVSDDPELLALPEGKLAMSAMLASLEQSVSGKLRAGDVIQIFAVEESQSGVGKYMSQAVPELQRVEVLSVTNSGAQSVVTGDRTPDMDRQVTTTVLAVDARQAEALARLGHGATLYAALVTRGDPAAKTAALRQQDSCLEELAEKEAREALRQAEQERQREELEPLDAQPDMTMPEGEEGGT